MRSFNHPRRSHHGLRTVLTAAIMTTALTGTAHADWTKDILDSRCEEVQRERMSEDIRDSIDESVRRAEASILPPTPVGDLGCLNELMSVPLDTFSMVGGLLGSLSAGLGSFDTSGLDLDIDVASMVCGAAATKWASLTTGLDASGLSLSQFADAGNMSSLIPSFSGSSALTPAQANGSISNYTRPDTAVSSSTSSLPIYPQYEDDTYDYAAEAAYAAQVDMANNEALARYIGCRVAANLNGTSQSGGYGYGTWQTHPIASDCSYAPDYIPPPAPAPAETEPETFEFFGHTFTKSSGTEPRAYGQETMTEPVVAPAPESKSTGNAIWDSLGQ